MGALPEAVDTTESTNGTVFGIHHMQQLFEEQRKYLDYFFSNVEYAQVQAFTQVLIDAKGVVFFTGVGKSGFVAQKVSQTFVSTGTKAAFLSPTDALHGDIGIVGPNDVLVLLSKSGATEELLRLVPCARAKGAYLVAITSLRNSPLCIACDMHVYLPLQRELCPFDLAPVTSTAIQMVFGDTVAIALMQAKNLTREQYALNHPAGRIGKRLIFRLPLLSHSNAVIFILQVQDVMKRQDELPLCKENDLIMDQLVELTSKGCGCLLVVDDEHRLIGTFTDGDLRRTLKSNREGVFKLSVGQMCNRNPRSIGPNAMAVEAMHKMESPPSPVQFLPVVDHNNVVIGIVTLHGLVSAGL
eukprot:Gb_31024 [translate_table: standard]